MTPFGTRWQIASCFGCLIVGLTLAGPQPLTAQTPKSIVRLTADEEPDPELPPDDFWKDSIDECCGETDRAEWLELRARVGGSYTRVPGEPLWGAEYGVDMAARLRGDWNFFSSGTARHFSEGTQWAFTTGFLRVDTSDCCDRLSFSVLYDGFTDTRVDDLYVSQLRTQLGYDIGWGIEAGVLWTKPLNRDNDVPFSFQSGGSTFFGVGSAQLSESLFSYISAEISHGTQAALAVGYRENPDAIVMAGRVSRSLAENLNVYAAALYGERFSVWGVNFGLEIVPGRRRAVGGESLAGPSGGTASGSSIQLARYVPPGGANGQQEITPEFDRSQLRETRGSRDGVQLQPTVTVPGSVLNTRHVQTLQIFSTPTVLTTLFGANPTGNTFFANNRNNVQQFNVNVGGTNADTNGF